jgi:hypothetical protein
VAVFEPVIEKANGGQEKQHGGESSETVSKPSSETPSSFAIAPSVEARPFPNQSTSQDATHATKRVKPENPNVVDEPMKAFERKMVWLTILGIAVAAITAAIFYVQIRIMNVQTQILAEQSEGASASASLEAVNTQKQLGIVRQQLQTTQRQTIISERALEASHRPYVGVDQIYYEADKPKRTWTTHIIMRNFGTNPAENTSIQSFDYENGVELKRLDQPS